MRTHFDFIKKQRGFSLAELLIYIGIVGIVAGLMTGIVSTVTKTQVEESAQNELTGQLNFAMQTIQRLVRESSLIDLTAGTPTSTLLLYTRTGTTTIYLQDGKVYVRQGGGATSQAITSDSVVVDALEFKKFTQYPAKDVVQIDLALSNATQASGRTVSRSLRSAVSRVSAATFDSDLLPGSDDSFKIGLTGGNRWEQGRFSKGISIGTAETYRTTSPPTGGMIIEGNVGIGTTSPQSILHVYGSGPTPLFIDSGSTGTYVNFRVANVSKGYVGYTPSGSGGMAFLDQSGTVVNMLVTNTGNVGIGTTTPGGGLEIYKTAATPTLRLNTNFGSGNYVDIDPYITGVSNNGLQISLNGTRYMVIGGTGNVGIGTTTPTTAGLVISTNVSGVGIDVRNNRIQNVGVPTNPSDAATKDYVEQYVGAAGGGGLSVYKSDGITLLGKYAGYFSSGTSITCDNILYSSSSTNNLALLSANQNPSHCQTDPTAAVWYYTSGDCSGTGSTMATNCGNVPMYTYNYGQVASSSGGGTTCWQGTPLTQRDPYTGACTAYTGGLVYEKTNVYINRLCSITGKCQIK